MAVPPPEASRYAPLAEASRTRERNEPPPTSSRKAGLLTRHLLAGWACAALAGLADAGIAALRPQVRNLDAWDASKVVLHLVAMYLPLGLAVGAGVAVLLGVLRWSPAYGAIAGWLAARHRWLEPAPRSFSHALAGLLCLMAGALGLWRGFVHFATRYHDMTLAGAALTVATLIGATLLVALAGSLSRALRPLAARMGKLASLGALGMLLVAAALAAIVWLAVEPPLLLRHADPWLGGLVALATVAYAGGALWLRLRMNARRARWWAALAVMMSTAAIVAIGLRYTKNQRVRVQIERASVGGLPLLRAYSRLTDRDGDGYAWAFGGGDCDDGNAEVHPGALDPQGDGIDQDCFAGDGGPPVDQLADGAYGKPPEGLERPNFLVITVDALRPDHLGAYGYERDTSKHIDAFARSAVRFDAAIAQSSRSIRSIPSMFTGVYPSQIRYGGEYVWPSLRPENITVAETLRDSGYRTVAVMGTNYFRRMGGFFQGFDVVKQDPDYKPPRDRVVTWTLGQLGRLAHRKEPWLLWTHLFHVHEPYLHDRKKSKYGPAYVDKYDTEVWYADRQVGRLLRALEDHGLEEDTVVVLASDHGEAFGEHGSYGHSYTLYGEELRSTLVIRVPGMAGGSVEASVGLMDLTPTLLNLAGVPLRRPVPSRSLVPLMHQPAESGSSDVAGERDEPQSSKSPHRFLISELLPDGSLPYDTKAIRRDGMKLIWWVREGTYQLFDLRNDPDEQHDVSDARRETAEELLGLLRSWVAQTALPDHRRQDILKKNVLDAPPADMSHPLHVRYSEVLTLLGYDLERARYRRGDTLRVVFYYRADEPTREDLFFKLEFRGPDGKLVSRRFHAHHYPVKGNYRTFEWKRGDVIRDEVEVVIPKSLEAPATLSMTLHVLDRDDNRVILPEGQRSKRLPLTELKIRR